LFPVLIVAGVLVASLLVRPVSLNGLNFAACSYSGAPTVTSINPTSGPTGGGTVVSVVGCGFTGATGVKFGTTAAGFNVIADTLIHTTAPKHVAGTVDITVSNSSGTSATSAGDQFTFVSPWCGAFNMSSVPTTWTAGQTTSFQVTVTNCGTATWTHTGYNEVDLDLHFANNPGGSANQSQWLNSTAFALPADLAPKASVTLTVTFSAPSQGGHEVIEALMIVEHSFWFDKVTSTPQQWAAVAADVTQPATGTWSATIDTSSIPTTWASGQSQTFTVKVTNAGNVTWVHTGYNEVDLDLHFTTMAGGSTQQQSHWLNSTAFALPVDVAPAGSATVTVTFTAPTNAGGTLIVEALVIREHSFWFDQVTATPQQWYPVTVTMTPSWSASIDMSTVPTLWKAGEIKAFSVKVTNTGSMTWPSTGYNEVDLDLHFATSSGGSANQANWINSQAFALPADVLPNANVMVPVTFMAADHPGGSLTLEGVMIKEHQFWFDAVTVTPQQWSPITATVVQAAYDMTSAPPAWTAGQTQTFKVTVTNKTTFTWIHTGYNEFDIDLHFTTTPGGSAQQGSWLTSQAFAMPIDLAPGASVSMNVTVTAPSTTGNMFLEAEMIKEHAYWFTDVSAVAVTVS
jgi:hypothetical protein